MSHLKESPTSDLHNHTFYKIVFILHLKHFSDGLKKDAKAKKKINKTLKITKNKRKTFLGNFRNHVIHEEEMGV